MNDEFEWIENIEKMQIVNILFSFPLTIFLYVPHFHTNYTACLRIYPIIIYHRLFICLGNNIAVK